MMLQELLYRYLSAEDAGRMLSDLDLSDSGSKHELVDRLEIAFRGMPTKKALSHFPRQALLNICEDNGIPSQSLSSFTDEEIASRVRLRVLKKERPKLDGPPWMR